jgi:AP-1-like factor
MDIDEAMTTGPMKYSPTDFSPEGRELHALEGSNGMYPQKHDLSQHRIVVSEDTGEALLPAGATWDYIQNSELFRNGLVDVGDVCERLKRLARCDGRGPVFEEGDVRRAIAMSARRPPRARRRGRGMS